MADNTTQWEVIETRGPSTKEPYGGATIRPIVVPQWKDILESL